MARRKREFLPPRADFKHLNSLSGRFVKSCRRELLLARNRFRNQVSQRNPNFARCARSVHSRVVPRFSKMTSKARQLTSEKTKPFEVANNSPSKNEMTTIFPLKSSTAPQAWTLTTRLGAPRSLRRHSLPASSPAWVTTGLATIG